MVSTLSVTETITWGILYYAFGVLLAPMERDMGWSRAQSTAAFSIALLLAAAGAVPVGRLVDQGRARVMMTLGSCAGTLLLVLWARVESLHALYLVWAGIGLTMATVLYEPPSPSSPSGSCTIASAASPSSRWPPGSPAPSSIPSRAGWRAGSGGDRPSSCSRASWARRPYRCTRSCSARTHVATARRRQPRASP